MRKYCQVLLLIFSISGSLASNYIPDTLYCYLYSFRSESDSVLVNIFKYNLYNNNLLEFEDLSQNPKKIQKYFYNEKDSVTLIKYYVEDKNLCNHFFIYDTTGLKIKDYLICNQDTQHINYFRYSNTNLIEQNNNLTISNYEYDENGLKEVVIKRIIDDRIIIHKKRTLINDSIEWTFYKDSLPTSKYYIILDSIFIRKSYYSIDNVLINSELITFNNCNLVESKLNTIFLNDEILHLIFIKKEEIKYLYNSNKQMIEEIHFENDIELEKKKYYYYYSPR